MIVVGAVATIASFMVTVGPHTLRFLIEFIL